MNTLKRLFGLDPGKKADNIKFIPRQLCHDQESMTDPSDGIRSRSLTGNGWRQINIHVFRVRHPEDSLLLSWHVESLLRKVSEAAGCQRNSIEFLNIFLDDEVSVRNEGLNIVICIQEEFVQTLKQNIRDKRAQFGEVDWIEIGCDRIYMSREDEQIDVLEVNKLNIAVEKALGRLSRASSSSEQRMLEVDGGRQFSPITVSPSRFLTTTTGRPSRASFSQAQCMLEVDGGRQFSPITVSPSKFLTTTTEPEKSGDSVFELNFPYKTKGIRREIPVKFYPGDLKHISTVLLANDYLEVPKLEKTNRVKDDLDVAKLEKALRAKAKHDSQTQKDRQIKGNRSNRVKLHVVEKLENFTEMDLLLGTVGDLAGCKRSDIEVITVLPESSFTIIFIIRQEYVERLKGNKPYGFVRLKKFKVDWIEIDKELIYILREPFEIQKCSALVFQGGGAKGIAYCGVVEVLQAHNKLANIKRFAGASAGAICAAFLAMGFSSDDLKKKLIDTNFKELLMGDRWYNKNTFTKLAIMFVKLLTGCGIYSTYSFNEWLGEEFEKKIIKDKIKGTGMRDITFAQLYTKYKKELCIIVTNVCTRTEEYYHPKTTPNFPVREAVRMSMSIPFLFRPKTLRIPVLDEDEYFIDGGVTCNFPIHCFDGWWLAMESRDDSFLERLQYKNKKDLVDFQKEGFSTRYRHSRSGTLGFSVMSQRELLQKDEVHAYGKRTKRYTDIPNTKLSREKILENETNNEGKTNYEAVKNVLTVLSEGTTTHGITRISRDVICRVLEKPAPILESILRKRKRDSLKEKTTMDYIKDKIQGYLWRDYDADMILVTFEDIQSAFLEITKHPFAEWITNVQRRSIKDFQDFFYAVNEMITFEGRKKNPYGDRDDNGRTIRINTGHVDTTDFNLEKGDKEFLINEGKEAMLAFLREEGMMKLTKVLIALIEVQV